MHTCGNCSSKQRNDSPHRKCAWQRQRDYLVIIAETVFKDRKAIGRIFSDSNTGFFSFVPTDGKTRLPDRTWRDVDELKAALRDLYAGDAERKAE